MLWWKKKPETDESLREELLAAKAKVERQLENMQRGPASNGLGWRDRYKENVAALTETLRQIDESLAELPETPQRKRR
jgi:hypothetical protein